ncbi:MAG: hypothetical protein B7Z73_10525 [Planctomycetia bacterium 21-64-5]|nr:MAG: hypothetical protein B7Z73_10525 [Planctomycetia bacterium 21-64-5]
MGPRRNGSGLRQLEHFIDESLEQGAEGIYADSLAHLEKYLFTRVLNHTGGNQSQAAKMLGITRGSLRNKIRTLKITIDQVVSVDDDAEEDEPASHAASVG